MQLNVQRPEMMETTALGAAYAAGIGIGWFTAEEILQQDPSTAVKQQTFEPEMSSTACIQKYKRWRKAVQLSYDLADLTDT